MLVRELDESRTDIEKMREKANRLALECPTLPEKQKLSKEEYAKMLLDCPVMTDKEFDEFEKTRKELRDDFNRRLGFVGSD